MSEGELKKRIRACFGWSADAKEDDAHVDPAEVYKILEEATSDLRTMLSEAKPHHQIATYNEWFKKWLSP